MIKPRQNLLAQLQTKSNINVSMSEAKQIEVEINERNNIDVSIDKMTIYRSRNEIAPHTHEASDINYLTDADTNITNVKEALDKLLYVNLSISLNSSIPTTLEKGRVIDNISFNWSYNKKVVSQIFNNEVLDANIRIYNYNIPFNTNKTFTLRANDGTNDFSKNISFSFLNGRYWGVSNKSSYDSNFINSLSKELVESRSKTFTVNCGEGQHIYYCIPSRFGNCSFKVGGFEGGFSKIDTIQFTNSSNYTESYDIYKSTNSNLGNTTVVVS